MISLDEALARILAHAAPLNSEILPLAKALGRTLAAPIAAKTNQPPFTASAMDGYAVRAKDVDAGTTLEMVGTSQAGSGMDTEIGPGQCARIFTGAPVPSGADAVIMQEKTTADGASIVFEAPVEVGNNIRTKGRDFALDQEVLAIGDQLTPAAIALAASAGAGDISTHRLPHIAVLATGDELVPPGVALGPGQITASNSIALSALFAPFANLVDDLGIASDDEADLSARLKAALESDADVIITTGGASVGDHDIVQPVLKSLGVEIDFWKIAMRPGKPLMFGKKGDTLVFGLPGNPVSAMVTAITVVLPALRALAGAPQLPAMRLPLAAPLAANGARRHFIRGIISVKGDGISAVRPLLETDSAHLSSLTKANALIIHREDAPAQPTGEIVDIIPI